MTRDDREPALSAAPRKVSRPERDPIVLRLTGEEVLRQVRRATDGSGSALISVSSDATHRSPQRSNKPVAPVVRGVLPAGAGVDPVQTTAKARRHFELRATATAGLVGNVIGSRTVKHRVGCNLSLDVGGLQFFQHDIPKFEIESAELNPSVGLTVQAAM